MDIEPEVTRIGRLARACNLAVRCTEGAQAET
jgi:hypothetical protein